MKKVGILVGREQTFPESIIKSINEKSKGKIVDGNRICHELGFEYQYPDPLVMPMA